MSRDELRMYSWIAAAAFLLVAGACNWRKIHWTALGSVLLFAAANAGAGIYVLNHLTDPRWAPEGSEPLTAPSFAGTPLVGQYLGPLDSALNAVVGGMNDFLAFQHALPIALDFLAVAGQALLFSFPMAIIALIVSFILGIHQRSKFKKYRATVDRLSVELEQIKKQLAAMTSEEPALLVPSEIVEVRSRLTRQG
ncbi:UNVERIFIED_ORG: hypothetical protein ABIB13_002500 [Arthrobacter sp. UYEF2]